MLNKEGFCTASLDVEWGVRVNESTGRLACSEGAPLTTEPVCCSRNDLKSVAS